MNKITLQQREAPAELTEESFCLYLLEAEAEAEASIQLVKQ
jgi:hypothetical protein